MITQGRLILCLIVPAFVLIAVSPGRPAESSQPLLKHEQALTGYKSDAPGVRRLITVDDIPKPDTAKSADRGPHVVPRPEGAMPKVPSGFAVDLLATNLNNPRKIVTAPNGDIFVSESNPGKIRILRE